MQIDETLRALYIKHKQVVENTPILNRVISLKEVLDILDISESSFRRSFNQGEFSEEKGDFRKIGASMFFDLEAILNRRYMDGKTYWALKEEYEKEKLNAYLFGDESSDDAKSNNDDNSLDRSSIDNEILNKINRILSILESE